MNLDIGYLLLGNESAKRGIRSLLLDTLLARADTPSRQVDIRSLLPDTLYAQAGTLLTRAGTLYLPGDIGYLLLCTE